MEKMKRIKEKLKATTKIGKKFKTLKPGKKIIVIGVLVVALLGGALYAAFSKGDESTAAQFTTAVVSRGNVKKVITATGTAELSQVMPLSFEEGGTIQEIYVKEGSVVKEGQPLVRLDTTTLEQELKEATENLASAQADYEQTLSELERKLKSDLVQAEKDLLEAEQTADPYYLENQYYLAELNLKAAEEELAAAQGSGESDTYQLQAALSDAQLKLIEAKNQKEGGAAKELELAKAEYEAALKALQDFENQTSSEFLSAKAKLTQSETEYLAAQEALDKATLKAPMDGTIISSDIELYQSIADEKTVMSLVADPKDFTVVASVGQADIGEIEVGQKVEMTLDTVPDEVIMGTVSGVSLQGTNTQNVITYDITIEVDEPSDILRDQMSVNISIIVEEVEDALIIPSQAVVTRGDATGVLLLSEQPESTSAQETEQNVSGRVPRQQAENSLSADGKTASGDYRFVEIETGIDDGTNVEVLSGLEEGQIVVIQSNFLNTVTTDTNQNTQRESGMGGMSMPGGMIPGSGGPRR